MIRKHSVTIRGHRTSISLEEPFWAVLNRMAERQAIPLARLIALIDAERDPRDNLSSAIRIHVLDFALRDPARAAPGGQTVAAAASLAPEA